MRIALRLAAGSLATLSLLPACRTLPPVAAPPWPERCAATSIDPSFEMRGRVAVADGERGYSAGIFWSERAGASEVTLTGPLSIGSERIRYVDGELTFLTADGTVLHGNAADAALEQALGFSPPLESLRHWVLGCPDPASGPAVDAADASGDTGAGFLQGGWEVRGEGFARSAGRWVPTRLTIRHDSLRVRLAIANWRLS